MSTSLFGAPAAAVDADGQVAEWQALASVFDGTQHVAGPFVMTSGADGASAHTHIRAYHQIKDAKVALRRQNSSGREVVLGASIRKCDGLAVATITHPHPALGPLSLYAWTAFAGVHEARHLQEIRERLGV
jgi:hypothetical protein